MVDNRTGITGVNGSFNFKSGDISGTAAKTSDDKQDQGTEYFQYGRGEEDNCEENYRDRSNELRASLNSLAAINSANIRLRRQKDQNKKEETKLKKQASKKVLSISENDAEKK